MCDFILMCVLLLSHLIHLSVPLSNSVDQFVSGADTHVGALDLESILLLTNYQKNKKKNPNDVNLVLSEVKSATNYGPGSFSLDQSECLLHFD